MVKIKNYNGICFLVTNQAIKNWLNDVDFIKQTSFDELNYLINLLVILNDL